MTDLKKAYPYGWTRKPTYEELDKIFDRCRELHQKAEAKLEAINKIANNPYPTNPFRLNKIREILKSEFKEKDEKDG